MTVGLSGIRSRAGGRGSSRSGSLGGSSLGSTGVSGGAGEFFFATLAGALEGRVAASLRRLGAGRRTADGLLPPSWGWLAVD